MPNLGPSNSFLLVLVVVPALVFPLVFLTLAVVAALRRRGGATMGPVHSASLAFAGGASLGTLLLVFYGLGLALPIIATAAAVAIQRWRAGRKVQAGWLLLGTGLPLPLIWVAAFLENGLSGSIFDVGAAVTFGAAAAAALVGIALVLRGDRRAPTLDVAGP